MSKVTLLGIDIAKNVFQLHGVDERGNPVLKRRLTRAKFVKFIAKLPPCTIAMEACGGANHWCRKFTAMGHETKQMSAQFVKPFVKTNKNDRNDAEGICEAASRPTMRFVSPKSVGQEDIQAIHRIRTRLVQERTALVNQIRGLLAEYGIVFAQGDYALKTSLMSAIEDSNSEKSDLSRELFTDLFFQFKQADEKVKEYEKKIALLAKEDTVCQRIMKIEGIGPLTATAIVSAVGNARNFKNGREMAAWLGLVPKHTASGEKKRLLGITKRGDNYLRKLLIQGGKSLILSSKMKRDKRSLLVTQKYATAGYNKTAVAVANKNARIIWALLYKNEEYKNVTA